MAERSRRGTGFIVLAAILVVVATMTASSVAAFSRAFFPTQSLGNRGSDVRAIQHLLAARGHPVPATGHFGSTTEGAVRAFQRRAGLADTGIVTPTTWAKLVMSARSGSTGSHVKALQVLLNEKRRAGLAVDGVFRTSTHSALVSFQRHGGVTADGVARIETWRNLVWHYEYPSFGRASLCDYNAIGGNGTAGNWGTGAALGQIEAAAATGYANGLGPVPIGDISLEHGGEIDGHMTHEAGLDLDLRPIRDDRNQCAWGTRHYWTSYDRAATRQLVKTIRATAPGHVKLIYFNDPVLIREGLTTYYSGHDGHLHVRYCEKVHPDARYDC